MQMQKLLSSKHPVISMLHDVWRCIPWADLFHRPSVVKEVDMEFPEYSSIELLKIFEALVVSVPV